MKDKIDAVIGDFGYLLPEMVLVLGAIILLVVELIRREQSPILKTIIAFCVLVAIAAATLYANANGVLFYNDLRLSSGGMFAKLILIAFSVFVLLFPGEDKQRQRGEFLFLLLMILLGSFIVLQSHNLLVFYLGVELISITSYLLIAFQLSRKGYEAGLKYLLFGAMASGLMLYGLSLLYGLNGSLILSELVNQHDGIWMTLALVMFFAGVLFKLSLVPMHIWTPDAYEAGPTSVVAYISVVPKIAVFIFLFEFVQRLPASNAAVYGMLSVIAILSMFIGNLSALAQTNAKRMMAYSSIAHSGYLLVGVISATSFGFPAMLFYLVVYGIMNMGAFYFISLTEKNGMTNIREMAGMGRKLPLVAVVIIIVMISLVGLPPTSGFTAKLLLFTSLWEHYTIIPKDVYFWLFVLGIFNAAISLIYYLKIPYFMILRNGEKRLTVKISEMIVLGTIGFLLLLIFFKPNLLLNMLNEITFAF